MTEMLGSYLTHTTGQHVALPPEPRIVEPPLSPRVRILVIGLRRVLLLAADVLGEFADLPKRE